MAKRKNKTSGKKYNKVGNNSNKKTRNNKKKNVITSATKKELKEADLVKKPTKKKSIKKELNVESVPIKKKTLKQNETIKDKKERNRKKYENKQKRIQDTKKIKEKKKIDILDETNGKEKKKLKEEKLVKKTKNIETEYKKKEKERKEKRKFNRKSINLTQTIANIKDKGVNKINTVKEKVNDKNIPLGKSEVEKKNRFKRFVKEAIVYAVILTIIDILCVLFIDYFNFLRLFDVKALNIVVTIVVALIFNFFIAFMIDHFATTIWLSRKRKKKVDDVNGDNRINEGEYKEDIRNKEGE